MRVYPYRNPDGSLEPHAYIVTTEEAPISAGPDYNDIVYIVRNVSPAAGAGGALHIQNLDAFPAHDFAVFSTITTITNCYTPLSVKDSGVIRIRNLSGGTITLSSIGTTPEFMATPSVPLPKDLASGESIDVTVSFVATTGRLVRSALTITSNDPAAPTRTVTLSGFRQVAPQSPHEPTLQEVVHDLFGYGTTIVGPGQDIDNEGRLEAVGDEVLSPYWVKADLSQPVSVRLMSAWHSGYYNCKTPPDVSYGSFIWWFEKGLKSPDNDHYLMGASKEDVQRVLPRDYEDPVAARDQHLRPRDQGLRMAGGAGVQRREAPAAGTSLPHGRGNPLPLLPGWSDLRPPRALLADQARRRHGGAEHLRDVHRLARARLQHQQLRLQRRDVLPAEHQTRAVMA